MPKLNTRNYSLLLSFGLMYVKKIHQFLSSTKKMDTKEIWFLSFCLTVYIHIFWAIQSKHLKYACIRTVKWTLVLRRSEPQARSQVLNLLNRLHMLWRCWLGGRKGIRPVKNWAVGCWRGYLSGVRCRLCICPSWCHCHSLSLASVKSRLVLSFWYRPTWVVPEKGR